MSKFLLKFPNESNYQSFVNSANYITPNVSWCVAEQSVKYNPYVEPEPEVQVIALESLSISGPSSIDTYDGHNMSGIWTVEFNPEDTDQKRIQWSTSGSTHVELGDHGQNTSTTSETLYLNWQSTQGSFTITVTSIDNPNISASKTVTLYSSR